MKVSFVYRKFNTSEVKNKLISGYTGRYFAVVLSVLKNLLTHYSPEMHTRFMHN